MLQAIETVSGSLVIPALFPVKEREKWKKDKTFSCPDCKQSVTFKNGTKTIPHFAHHSNASCPGREGGEGQYHERGKLQLYEWLRNQHLTVELEAYLPEIQQRPDLLITIHNRKIALEYQCASISPVTFWKRTNGYLAAGITPIWILGGNRQKRAGINALFLTSNDNFFLHQYRSEFTPILYFYCSRTQQFCFFHHIHFTGRRKNYGHLHYTPLRKMNFTALFKWKQQPDWLLEQEWIEDRKYWRLLLPRIHQRQLREWHNWLYQAGYHPSTLPSLAGIPVKSQFKLVQPPVIWQSEILIRILLPLRIGDIVNLSSPRNLLSSSFISPSCNPLVHDLSCPVEEYFQLLVRLGYLQNIENSSFQKKKEIIFHKNVETALQADQQLYREMSQIKELSF